MERQLHIAASSLLFTGALWYHQRRVAAHVLRLHPDVPCPSKLLVHPTIIQN